MHLQSKVGLVAAIFAAIAAAQVEVQSAHGCPGAFFVAASGSATTSACCVGGHVLKLYQSVCSGWPICNGNPTTTTQTNTPLSCATVINYTDDNYSSLVSEASVSLEASGTHIQTTLNGLSAGGTIHLGPSSSGAANTGGSASVTGSASTAMGGSSATSAAASSSTGGAGTMAVQLGLLGGGVLGAAILL